MKTNQELLEEANKIEFKLKSNGALNARLYGRHERGLFFIKKAIELHGINTYQYGLVQYVDNNTKVPVLCYKHGEFLVTPSNHVNKASGCPKCSGKYQPTTKEWIEKARMVHGNKYDYCSTNYKCAAQKVVVICPEHGPFLQEARSHLQGTGCAKCSNNYQYDTNEWITLAKKVHGDRYDYSKAVYTNSITKVEILCPDHGPFLQTPFSHTSGHGCPKCSNVHQYDTNEWITLAKKVHGDRYDYSKAVYTNSRTKVEIICPDHGVFLQTPSNHLNFQGCPKCKGKNHNILYLLRCSTTGLHKIGITTDDVAKRMSGIGGNLEEVFHVVCENPGEHETYLLKLYKEFNVYHNGVNNGNTEFFSLNEEHVAKIRQYMASIAINQKAI